MDSKKTKVLPSIDEFLESLKDSQPTTNLLPALFYDKIDKPLKQEKNRKFETKKEKPLFVKIKPLPSEIFYQFLEIESKEKKNVWKFEKTHQQNRGRKGKQKDWQIQIKKFYT
jgi:hypothetical protein